MTRRPLFEKGNGWQLAAAAVLFPATWALGRAHYEGLENLARPGPVLVVANHISHVDPVFDAIMVRKTGRLPHIVAKSSLWHNAALGRVLTGTQMIPVERGGGQAALTPTLDALAAGRVVLIYPEGTVTRDPERWPMRPRPGVGGLALAGDFPVIPLAGWGTHRIYASYAKDGKGGRFRPLPRKDVLLRAGEPVDLSDLRAQPADARVVLAATYRIMGAVRDLVGELRGEIPPEQFYNPRKAARATDEHPDGSGENR